VTGVSHKRVVMSSSNRSAAYTMRRRHDGVSVLRPGACLRRRSDASDGRTPRAPSSRAAQFSKTAVRNDGPRRLAAPPQNTKKAPLGGAQMLGGRSAGRWRAPLGGCSFRDPKQERPRSIAMGAAQVHRGGGA
jgi:hypothetical protein